MKKIVALAALMLAGTVILWGQEPPATLEITYLANEGFLLRSGNRAVIIDGLFREGVEPYATLSPEWRQKMETAQPPFDQVEVILVSHFHADHFDPQAVGRHLKNNPKAILISSAQVVTRMELEFDDFAAIEGQVRPVLPVGGSVVKEVAGIKLEIWRVTHGRDRFASVENLGHIVTLDGKKVLHIGDSVAGEEDLKQFHWAEQKIDVALLPYWYFLHDEWKPYLKPLIGSRYLVAIHIPPAEVMEVTEQIHAAFPEALVFTRALETKRF